MNSWIDLAAISKILVFGLILGGAVPTVFALGLRLNIAYGGAAESNTGRRRLMVGLSWLLFAVTVVIVMTGVLYISNNFIGHHTGLYLFGTGARHAG